MDYLTRLSELTQPYAAVLNLQLQLDEVHRCLDEIGNEQLLSRPFPRLGLTQDDWWLFIETASQQRSQRQIDADFAAIDHLLRNFRKFLQYRFGQWTLISQQALDIWAKYWPSRRYLELMAGNGALSKALHQRGQAVIATDSFSWQSENVTGRHLVYPVENFTASAAVAKYGQQVDAIILSWSPDCDPLDWALLNQIRQLTPQPDLLVIGEKFGVTNSELFWRTQVPRFSPQVQLINRYLPQHDQIAERLFLFR